MTEAPKHNRTGGDWRVTAHGYGVSSGGSKLDCTKKKKMRRGYFPDDPVVRNWRFHCPGPGVRSLVGELRS